MAYQTQNRGLSMAKNLVLDLYVQISPVTGILEDFVSEIHETSTQGAQLNDLPLFYCRGTGYTQFTSTLTHIINVFNLDYSQKLKNPCSSWILSCENDERRTYQIRIQIRHQKLHTPYGVSGYRPELIQEYQNRSTFMAGKQNSSPKGEGIAQWNEDC